jgi:hypothetical protein
MNFINDTSISEPKTDHPQETADEKPLPISPIQERHLTVRRMPGLSTHDEVRPYLAFGGLFLKKYGFFLGKKLTVKMEVNKITISVDEPGEGPKELAKEESAKRSILSMREIGYRLMLTQNYLNGSKDGDPGQQTKK